LDAFKIRQFSIHARALTGAHLRRAPWSLIIAHRRAAQSWRPGRGLWISPNSCWTLEKC